MLPQYDDNLSRLQGLQLIQESNSARHLIAYGIRVLRTSARTEPVRDPILTMLSIGVEKTMKLALGLLSLAEHRVWLPYSVLKNTYRHNLLLMDGLLRDGIREHVCRATHRSYVDHALQAVDEDPVWMPLLIALNHYGEQGRFYYVDALADRPQKEDSPEGFWADIEEAARESDPELDALLHRYWADSTLIDEYHQRLHARIADSLQRWWDLVSMASVQGVLGGRGEVLRPASE
ncbi:hypothetical protein [Microbacterium sp. P5_E9]